MGKIYHKEQKINGYECDWHYSVQPTAIMNYFQQASQEQSEELGVGPEVMDEKGLAWFLVKYHLRFKRYPRFNTTVTVETEPMAFDKFAAHRRFAILDDQGGVMVEADTEWMLLNRREDRLERMNNVPELAVYESGQDNQFKLRRLKAVKDWEAEKHFQVRYQDIDFNAHVNHVNYLAWALETLPVEKMKHEAIESAKIIYKNQGFYGDVITAKQAEIEADTYRIDIFNQEEILLCQIELVMRKGD